ncbi:Cation/H(+) antiporter 2 [Linum perenne]
MDQAKRLLCTHDLWNPLNTTFVQTCGMLLVSQIFHVILKPLGQPGPVAQILAGLVLGPSLLCKIDKVRHIFIQPTFEDYSFLLLFVFRILFMFTIGLEADLPYISRNFQKIGVIAGWAVSVCAAFGAAASFFVINVLKITSHKFAFANIIMIIVSSVASPVVVRLVAELKFDTADVGRLAISTALFIELFCITWFSTYLAFSAGKMFGFAIVCVIGTGIVAYANRFLALWCNKRSRNMKFVPNTEMSAILVLVILLSFMTEKLGYNSMISCFLVGVAFPREGKTTRTLLHRLTYAVNNFILPIYFGFNGFRFDVNYLVNVRNCIVVVLVIVLSMGGKIIGTLFACHYLKIPRKEGVVLAFILNLKGHGELLVIEAFSRSDVKTWWDDNTHKLVIIIVVINTLIAGPVVSFILKREEKYFAHNLTFLEFLDPDHELRFLQCVYESRHITSKLGLISAMTGSQRSPTVIYLLHLIELLKKHRRKKKLMYNELQDGDQFSDDEEYGGNDMVEINDAVDGFTTDSKILVHQNKAVNSFPKVYEDVCAMAEDMRVSIVFLTFHKHQRLDGKLENDKDGVRIVNQKVLRHAPCSVGIFVDRGLTGFQLPSPEVVQNVATLFFGGPDDREALACCKRIALHPYVNLTVIRFQSAAVPKNKEVHGRKDEEQDQHISISSYEVDMAIDNVFMEDFCNRYVTSGKVKYVEERTENGEETVEILKEIGEMYSMFIVGKGGRGSCPMTTGMSDWEECPELGAVGDILASAELNLTSSILVIQQHKHATEGRDANENPVLDDDD